MGVRRRLLCRKVALPSGLRLYKGLVFVLMLCLVHVHLWSHLHVGRAASRVYLERAVVTARDHALAACLKGCSPDC